MKKVLMLTLSAIFLSVVLAATSFAATYTVTNTANGGAGSLRRAISDANGNPGLDTIDFNIAPAATIQTIQPTAGLPNITEDVYIDGFTQPGASASPRTILIEINGALAGASNGLRVTGGTNVIIRGLAINGFANNGIRIDTNGNTIEGCVFGAGPKGLVAKPNGDNGILIAGGSNNIIGGSALIQNIISGNTNSGIRIQGGGSGNTIQNNYIGPDSTGVVSIGNSLNGVFIVNSPSNTVGGLLALDSNLISGNGNDGIRIDGAASTGNNVQGNYIGIANDGITPLGNVVGVEISGGALNTIIGGTLSSGRNIIGGNTGNGVEINNVGTTNNTVSGNYIGLGLDGSTAAGNGSNGVDLNNSSSNTIGGAGAGETNVIVANTANGIRLRNAGATLNNIYGNYIGVRDSGGVLVDIGNTQSGILITNQASVNYVGGSLYGQGNIISGNDQDGVEINGDIAILDANEVIGNYIGTDSTGAALGNSGNGVVIKSDADGNKVYGGNTIAFNGSNGVTVIGGNSTGNLISQNSIHSNILLGVDLRNDGVDINDVSDVDGGPNNSQNYPVITSVSYDGVNTNIIGSLNSTLTTNFNIDLYSNTSVDPSGYGEGETYLMTTNVTTDAVLGDAGFAFAVPGDQRALAFTTLAYDSVSNDTSEFGKVDLVDIAITKTINNPAPKVTENVTYTITVTNNGPDTATGVKVMDLLPSALAFSSSAPSQGVYAAGTGIWAVGTLLNSASATLTLTGTVKECGSTGNTATVSSDQFDNVSVNNSASVSYSNSCPVAGGYREGSNLSKGIINENSEEVTTKLAPEVTGQQQFCLDYKFDPKDTDKISRFEFLYLMLQLNCFDIQAYVSSRDTVFNDLPRVNYLGEDADLENLVTEVMYTGYDEGIIKGYPDSSVKPYNDILLAEAAKMVFKSTHQTDQVSTTGLWYETYINYLQTLLGDNTLDPASTVTKSQANNIVDKLLNK